MRCAPHTDPPGEMTSEYLPLWFEDEEIEAQNVLWLFSDWSCSQSHLVAEIWLCHYVWLQALSSSVLEGTCPLGCRTSYCLQWSSLCFRTSQLMESCVPISWSWPIDARHRTAVVLRGHCKRHVFYLLSSCPACGSLSRGPICKMHKKRNSFRFQDEEAHTSVFP